MEKVKSINWEKNENKLVPSSKNRKKVSKPFERTKQQRKKIIFYPYENVVNINTKETRAENTKIWAKFNPKTHQSKPRGSPCPRRIGKIADYFSRIGVNF